jgi:hypothetical protein
MPYIFAAATINYELCIKNYELKRVCLHRDTPTSHKYFPTLALSKSGKVGVYNSLSACSQAPFYKYYTTLTEKVKKAKY